MIADQHSEPDSQNFRHSLPPLGALRCFEAAARLENFSRAADELHLTHGAISRAVRQVEVHLGLPLFERRQRRVFLNDAGRLLFHAVRDGLETIRQAADALRTHPRPTRRWVLSCEPTLLMRWLIPRWPAFQARHPELQIHLSAGGGPFAFDDGIDLAIRRDDFPWPAGTHAEPLFAERVGPVCRPDQLAAWFSGAGTQALRADAPRLHTHTRPQAWSEWARHAGQRLRPARQPTAGHPQWFEHFYFSLQAAIAGLGVAIAPWHLACDDLASGVLSAPLGFVEDGSHYWLLSPGPPAAGTAPQQLLAWLREIA